MDNKNFINALTQNLANLFKNPKQIGLKTSTGKDFKTLALIEETRFGLNKTIDTFSLRVNESPIKALSNQARTYYLKEIEGFWFFLLQLNKFNREFNQEKLMILEKCLKVSTLFENLLKPSQRKTKRRAAMYIDHFLSAKENLEKELK